MLTIKETVGSNSNNLYNNDSDRKKLKRMFVLLNSSLDKIFFLIPVYILLTTYLLFTTLEKLLAISPNKAIPILDTVLIACITTLHRHFIFIICTKRNCKSMGV